MSTTVDTLRIKVEMDTKQAEAASKRLDKSVDKLEKSTDKTSKSFKSRMGDGVRSATGPAIAALGGLAAGATLAVNSASDLGESINAVNVTFGKSAKGILSMSDAAATSVGLSKTEFNGLAVQFSSFAETIAGKGGDVVGTMGDITGRAADFASVMNMDVAEAAQKFQSGLAGETEPLKKFGIDLSAAKVAAYAYANGIAEQGTELTETQKVQARYAVLMQQTAKTQGDFQNTSDSLANSTRIMKAEFENTKAELGTSLIPVFQTFVKYIKEATAWASRNQGTVKVLAVTLTALAATVLVVRGAMIAYETATKLAAAAQWLFATRTNQATGATVASRAAVIASTVAQVAARVASLAWAGVMGVVTAAQWALNVAMAANPIGLIIIAIVALVAIFVVMYKKVGWFRTGVDKLWAGLKVVFGWAVKYIKFVWSVYAKVFGWILGVIKKVIDWVRQNWRKLIPFIIGPVGIAVKWVIQHWDKIRDVFRKVIGGIKNTIGNIVRPFKTAFSKVVGIVKGAINFILRAWNALDFGLHIAVPSWVPKIGGKGFHIDDLIPDIPMLASGGIVTRPTLAMIGEAGPEAVVPLSKGRGYGTTVINNPTFTTNVNGAHDPVRTAGRVADAEESMLRGLIWSVRTA